MAQKEAEIEELEKRTSSPDLWNDQQAAQELMKKLTRAREDVEPWRQIAARCVDLGELAELAQEDDEETLAEEIRQDLGELRQQFHKLELSALFSGPYDDSDAILSINAGAGGVDAQDWSQMLSRMYTRWAEENEFGVEIVDWQEGDEAGIKSMVAMMNGHRAYGRLRAERGVHRLVRLSPFDAAHRRHTSFAAVDVIPQISEDIEVDVRPEDLKVDTYRASGAGGQHVNKTDSAVRITHLPTGLVVQCQNERSQHRNRDMAMRVLKAKLFEQQLEEQQEELESLRGAQSKIEWGSQIRSYVFHPYSMVKDHRTNHETSGVEGVMDGDLDGFIRAFLEMTSGGDGRD